MPDDVKISEMSEAASLDNSAQFPYVQSMNGNLTTLKAPLSQIGTKINEGMTFSNLQTTSKNIVGAINEVAQGGGVDYATELPISSTDPTDTKSYIDTKTTLVKSASGSLIHITDGGDNIPLKSCEIEIAPDLTGHTEANLVVCGVNLCATNLFSDGSSSGVSYSIDDDGKITISANSPISNAKKIDIGLMTLPAGTYKLTGVDTNIGKLDLRLRTDINLGSTEFAVCNNYNPSVSFTLTETTTFYAVFILLPNFVGTAVCEQMISLSSDTEYHAYNGIVYNIPFGQTVTAGGTLDVISGELVVGGVTTQLTPVSPKTISGVNNIYNDCGDTAIEYFTSSADGLAALIEVLSNS